MCTEVKQKGHCFNLGRSPESRQHRGYGYEPRSQDSTEDLAMSQRDHQETPQMWGGDRGLGIGQEGKMPLEKTFVFNFLKKQTTQFLFLEQMNYSPVS